MNTRIAIAAGLSLLAAGQAFSQVILYEKEGFRGATFMTDRQERDFRRKGFNDRASSIIVDGGQWEVCEDPGFKGRCVVLRPGSYDSLRRLGVDNRVSSVRRVGRHAQRDDYYAAEPMTSAPYEWRRRPRERVFEAPVVSVRAIMGVREQQCWVERDVGEAQSRPSVGGGIVGGIIGGIIGHQIGDGTGRDIATVGGAVAGAAIGANAGRDRRSAGREVRRCETTDRGEVEYWDVRYRFRNIEHHVQMTEPPGRTILVNSKGEPRQ
jgi:uncharacterized protein YcfJ